MAKAHKPKIHPRFNRNTSLSDWHREEGGYGHAFGEPPAQHRDPFVPAISPSGTVVTLDTLNTVASAMLHVEGMHVSAAEDALATVREMYFGFYDPHRSTLKDKLSRLYDEWQQQTGHLSRTGQRASHMAHLSIIGMGPAAVPLILEKMQEQPGEWFLC